MVSPPSNWFRPGNGKLRRIAIPAFVFVLGLATASLVPGVSASLRGAFGLKPAAELAKSEPAAAKPEDDRQIVKLSDEQFAAAQISLVVVDTGTLAKRVIVPGTVVPNADKIAHVSVRLVATVAELRKRLGDPVEKDEIVAVLESREVADAKSEYLAARLTNELQQDLFQRDKALWEKNYTPEQTYLRSRNTAAQSQVRFDIARQKLLALGVSETEIASLPKEPEALLRRQAIRSPIAGRVVERKVDLGAALGRDNLETELFVVADLSVLWVELAVSPSELPSVKEGQPVTISARTGQSAEGKIVFISPVLDKDSRAARVVAQIDNKEGQWRPGSFVTASVAVEQQLVALAVPSAAVMASGTEKFVFVRQPEGFEKRPVALGRSDARTIEIVSGLKQGEQIAATNTYLLKAEALKGQAED
ncbi:MAG: efflux RND transporter periplasmic adaptor subunit [Xanthobacteraceae bacterium]|nr:efflux RND transporter periplasmic adaptor subunit [Xanthobacteraceae bacterium]